METQYHGLLSDILENGVQSEDRTGVGTLSVFGRQMRFDLKEGFPIVTTKKLPFKLVVGELLWFLEGSTDERRLAELTYGKPRGELTEKTTIWTANADKQGKDLGYINNASTKELGPVYGAQWRDFNGATNVVPCNFRYDQVKTLINDIKNNPNSRRLIISAWNPAQLSIMALPPCHILCQFYVRNNKLSCMMTQRSGDAFLGIPFNIVSYSLLTHIIAKECNLDVGDFVHSIGDAHIYLNHNDQVKEQLSRRPYTLPKLTIDKSFDLIDGLKYGFDYDSVPKFNLIDYQYHPTIHAEMAV